MRKWPLCFFILVCAGCTTKPVVQDPTATVLDSTRVSFKGAILDHDALMQLKQGTLSHEEWTNVLPVMVMPADSDADSTPEVQLNGDYTVNDTSIIFTSGKPFAKHTQYSAHFYSSDSGLSYLKMARSKENLKGPVPVEFKFKVD